VAVSLPLQAVALVVLVLVLVLGLVLVLVLGPHSSRWPTIHSVQMSVPAQRELVLVLVRVEVLVRAGHELMPDPQPPLPEPCSLTIPILR
jgi:hypothetical protein